ncbi:MAG: hypothetical protein GY798_26160 [Hyphomicrobiales bacterium]|nr:hypothetical protein [Hyphomicrobiales bacterium]
MRAGIEVRAAHFPGRAPIDAYGNGGFRFAGMSHRGSILCLPSGIHGWDSPAAIDLESLARVLEEAAEIDVLLVGMGADFGRLDPVLTQRLRDAGVVADTMSTGAAVRTYNVLVAERRPVAAALVAVD